MKSYCLLITILAVAFNTGCGEIKNGYEKDIISFRISLKGLQEILRESSNLSVIERRKIKAKIKALIDQISYYEVTQSLLSEFKMLSPELYDEIDGIKDSKGRITNVYVKFIPKEQARVQAAGTTSLAQDIHDKHAYTSEYGEGTVSVKIWIVSNAILVLSHEFGHVKYQVPHLASYVEFYKTNYQSGRCDPNHLGHNPNDPSGRNAIIFEKRFREYHNSYRRNGHTEFVSPLLLLEDVRKQIELQGKPGYPLAKL